MSLAPSGRLPPLAELALFGPPGAGAAPSQGLIWTWRSALAAHAALAAFAIVAGLFWTLSDTVVPWDSKNQFYPFFRFLADSLARGDFPLWNPYHFGGHPSIADPQSLIFAPTMVLFALASPQASMHAFDGVVLAHLAMGGVGVMGLFRRRGWHPAGAVLAAVVFMFAGPAASRLQHTGMILSYSFLPLALWALEAALERASYAIGLLFAVVAVMMALGRDQVAFFGCAMMLATAAWRCVSAPAPLAWLRRRWLLLLMMALVGGALMAVPVLLTLQFLGASNRPGISYGVAVTGSMTPVNFVTLLIPNIFGSLNWNYAYWGPGYETTPEANWTDRAINYLFIGTVPAILALWHGAACGRLFARNARYFAILALLAGFYAVGRYAPLFAFIFDHVPGVSLYRRPADATFILNFALACGAGYLLHRYVADGQPRLWRGLPRPAAWLVLLGFIAACGVVFAAALELSANGGRLEDALRSSALSLALCLAVAVALLAARTQGQRGAVALLAVFGTMGELIWRNASSSLNSEPTAYYSIFDKMNPTEAEALRILRAEIASRHERGEFPRVEILGLSGPWQNAAMVLGLEDTLGYNPLRISEYERAVGPGENAGDPNLRQFPGTFRGYRSKLASLLGLEYLILDRPLAKLPRHFPRPPATSIFNGERFYVYRLGRPAPRAYFALRAKRVDSEAVLDEHVLPEFDRASEALIDQADFPSLSKEVAQAEPDAAHDPHVMIAAHHPDDVLIEVDAQKPGIIILHDLFYPGWMVQVDGKPARMLRANILFRGVEVPAGHHIVEFTFDPLLPSNLIKAAQNLIRVGEE